MLATSSDDSTLTDGDGDGGGEDGCNDVGGGGDSGAFSAATDTLALRPPHVLVFYILLERARWDPSESDCNYWSSADVLVFYR